MFLCFSLWKRKVASHPLESPLQNMQHNNNGQSKWVTCNIRRRLVLKDNEACLLCPEQVKSMYFGLLLWLRCFVHVHKSYGFFVDCSKMKTNKTSIEYFAVLHFYMYWTTAIQSLVRGPEHTLPLLREYDTAMVLKLLFSHSLSRGKSDQAFLSKTNIEGSAEYT